MLPTVSSKVAWFLKSQGKKSKIRIITNKNESIKVVHFGKMGGDGTAVLSIVSHTTIRIKLKGILIKAAFEFHADLL